MAASLLPLNGCLMRAVDKDPKPPVEMPDTFGEGDAEDIDPGPWWTSFNDPELNALVVKALDKNLMLRQSRARLDQAKAMERMAAAGLFPTVGASVSAARSMSAPREFSLMGNQTTVPGLESNTFSMSMPVSYEIDVWGKVRAGMLAAEQDVVAFRADLESAAVTIAANVTERWFDVVEQRAMKRLVVEQLAVNKQSLQLVELRFAEGDAGLSDVYQQRQQIQALEAQLTIVLNRERVAEQQLALLLGQSPKRIVSAGRVSLPDPPPLPKRGVPASLLERRPDLRSAKARVVAADYRIAQAIAQRLPSFTLSGSLGFSATSLEKLFESFVWSIMGSVTGAVWDGGRMDAEIDRNEAVLDERLAAYGQVLLTALVEVESSLTTERLQGDRIRILELQVATARQTLASARRRFSAGIGGSYISVLTALRSLQAAEQALLTSKRQLLSQRVQLYRALGSRWTAEIEASGDDEEDPS
jgi:multidrug efflux system outer membrane protein